MNNIKNLTLINFHKFVRNYEGIDSTYNITNNNSYTNEINFDDINYNNFKYNLLNELLNNNINIDDKIKLIKDLKLNINKLNNEL